MASLFDQFQDTSASIPEPQSKVTLRPYQREAVDAVFSAWQESRSALVCLPTGCGKSVVFSAVMKRWVEENT